MINWFKLFHPEIYYWGEVRRKHNEALKESFKKEGVIEVCFADMTFGTKRPFLMKLNNKRKSIIFYIMNKYNKKFIEPYKAKNITDFFKKVENKHYKKRKVVNKIYRFINWLRL